MEGGERLFGMAVPKTMVKVDEAWWSKVWDRWVTISKISVLLKNGTAMAAEVAGVCVLTGVLDLLFNKSLCVQKINQCINRILNTQWCGNL